MNIYQENNKNIIYIILCVKITCFMSGRVSGEAVRLVLQDPQSTAYGFQSSLLALETKLQCNKGLNTAYSRYHSISFSVEIFKFLHPIPQFYYYQITFFVFLITERHYFFSSLIDRIESYLLEDYLISRIIVCRRFGPSWIAGVSVVV